MGEVGCVAVGRGVDQAEQALGPVVRGVVVAAVLRADIDGGGAWELAAVENLVELGAVGAGEEDVVTTQAQAGGARVHGPGDG